MGDPPGGWPSLPQIQRPRGALATALQTSRLVPEVFPRASAYRPSSTRGAVRRQPAPDAAPWFHRLFNGWMGARSPLFATQPDHVTALRTHEDAELHAAAKRASGQMGQAMGVMGAMANGPDESLAERRVAITLLLPQDCSSMNTMLLDGLTHWASAGADPVIRTTRITVLAGRDAHTFTEQLRGQGAGSVCDTPARLVLRWVDSAGALRSELAPVTSPSSTDQAACRLHQAAVALGIAYGAPLAPSAYPPGPPGAKPDAFADLLLASCDAFFLMVRPTPTVALSPTLAQQLPFGGADLVPVNVLVRIQPRTPHALEECEHGTLLAPAAEAAAVRARCVDHVNSHGAAPLALPVPVPAGSEWANVHMCAARAVPCRFGPNITLYAPGGIPGAPTDGAGSYAWRLSVGVGPVDAALLQEVDLIPCAPNSARPGLGALEPFCRNFHGQAVKLFKALGRPPQLPPPSQPRVAAPAEETGVDDDVHVDDDAVASPYPSVQFVLTALRLDLQSPRCTIGEALAYLMAHQGPPSVVGLFKSVARALGLATPLVTMLEGIAGVLDAAPAAVEHACAPAAPAAPAPEQTERERLERMCDALLRLPPAPAPQPGRPPARAAAAATIRRVTRGCQLKTRHEVLLLRQSASPTVRRRDLAAAVEAIRRAVAQDVTLNMGTIEHCKRLMNHAWTGSADADAAAGAGAGADAGAGAGAAAPESWRAELVRAVRAVIDALGTLAQRGTGGKDALFFAHTDCSAQGAAAELVLEEVVDVGAYRPTEVSQVLTTPSPRLLALQIGNHKAQLTACA